MLRLSYLAGMEFKLSFEPERPARLLNYRQPVLLTGSCFSDHISRLLTAHYFDAEEQPNGIVFNPVSIAQHLEKIIDGSLYTGDMLHHFNELWHSWEHHGSFNSTDKEMALVAMNEKRSRAHHQLQKKGAVLLVTLGSGFAYTLKGGEPVANCHKYPGEHFNKKLLSPEEIVRAFAGVLERIPDVPVYFTVSPVRHVRDGLVQNNLSKAVLIQAAHELCSRFANCYYFPAYEIVTDELRDYRFYEQDMAHPNHQAVMYVWQRFIETCMDPETRLFMKEAARLNGLLQHRALHEDTIAFRQFDRERSRKLTWFEDQYGVKVKR